MTMQLQLQVLLLPMLLLQQKRWRLTITIFFFASFDLFYISSKMLSSMPISERLEMFKSQNTRSWVFREEDFSAKDGRTIAEALNATPAAEEFQMKKVRPLTGAMEEIADGLKENTTLKTFDMRRCNVTVGAAKALAEAFRVNKTVTTLIIHELDAPPEALAEIVRALAVNTGIKTVDFRCNPSPLQTIQVVGQAMKSNNTITKLLFYSAGPCFPTKDQMSDKGAAVLADMLKVNTGLRTLDVQWNCITVDGAMQLLEATAEKKTLQLLDLSYNSIAPSDKDKLLALNKTKGYVRTMWCCSH